MKRDREKRKKCIFRNVISYCRGHMWCSFALAILASIILLLLIIMVYMKKQYYTYLVETSYVTENALLDSVNKNIETQLEEYVNIGSALSVDDGLVKDIFTFLNGNKDANGYKRIRGSLQTKSRTSTNIVGIALADRNEVVYQYDKNEKVGTGEPIWDSEQSENIQNIFSELREKNTMNTIPRYIIITSPGSHPNAQNKGILHIAFPLREGYSYKNMQYMMLVSYYSQPLSELLEQLNENQEQYIQGYMEDGKGEILLHTGGRKFVGMDADEYKKENQLTDLTNEVNDYGWKLHAVIDEKMLQNKVDTAYNKMIFLYFIAILVILLILFWTTNRILHPINVISDSISKVKKGDIKEQITIQGTNEIWQLAQAYNEMLQTIWQANEELKEQRGQVI